MSGPGAIARRVVMAASRFCPAARRESGGARPAAAYNADTG